MTHFFKPHKAGLRLSVVVLDQANLYDEIWLTTQLDRLISEISTSSSSSQAAVSPLMYANSYALKSFSGTTMSMRTGWRDHPRAGSGRGSSRAWNKRYHDGARASGSPKGALSRTGVSGGVEEPPEGTSGVSVSGSFLIIYIHIIMLVNN